MEDKRVADYFVVAGLPQNPTPLDEIAREANSPKATQPLLPITDIAVIIRSQGELPPKGYTCIESTPFGFPADLNHGSLRSHNIYLCFRRGRDKPPLVDIGVLYDGKERVMADSEVVLMTPSGRSANVNNSGSRTFLTYRRALDNAPCNQLVVTDICIILANKNENPPRAFCLIDKNLNKGVLGSDVFLCYKKSMNRPDMICYTPGILDRFPLENYEGFPLPQSVAVFCLPMGATVECWPKSATQPKPLFSTFVLTSDSAEKVYGAAVTFYEKFADNKLEDSMRKHLNYITEDHQRTKDVHANKSVCILSRWPFYDTFEKFLRYLHRISTSGVHKVPLERIISHFMLEIPFPSPQRPRILFQLADCTVSLAQPEDSPLPLSGASYVQLLKNLGPDDCLRVLFYVLTEQKLLFHSLRPDVLTSVAETVVHFIFPFHWQCPYIPLCPLGLSDVLSAPVPYLVGVDSRYFDLYDPPHDVTCIDLDTNSIFLSEEKRNHNVKLLPKRPARILRNTLHNLHEKLAKMRNAAPPKTAPVNSAAFTDFDFRVKKRERQLELEIQEAFLRFMSSLLKGYRHYLKPITTAPTIGTTDPNSLFDLQGFLKSRDKTHSRFYMCMMKTQMFIRFIEERSFVSDKDAGLAFFDDCTEKVDSSEYSDVHLLEMDDSHKSDRTVFIAPPEPIGLPPGVEYRYKEFGTLKPQLFHRHPAKSLLSVAALTSPLPSSPMARRTKQEIKNAQRIARKQSEIPLMWAKCLVGYCFSLWFIHLPALVKVSPSKASALRMAFEILTHLQQCKHNLEEVCYRVLMLLCGLYSQPTLAVKVLFEMKRHGIQPNAITYGYYNKAVLESKWPSADAGQFLMWNKLRNVIMGVAQFRQGLKKKARRSLSLCSDLDYDRISRTSTESSNPEDITLLKIHQPTENATTLDLVKFSDDQSSSGGQSDCGYSSLNHEDGLKLNSCQPLNGRNSQDPLPTLKTIGGQSIGDNKTTSARSLKFRDIDFSASDAFRSRVGSIVKSSATSLNSLAQLQDAAVDSSAGILMTSQTTLIEDRSFNNQNHEPRRRHKSAGERSCQHYKRYRMLHCTGSLSENAETPNQPPAFLRSYSFGNDFQIIRKIREAKGELEKNGLVTKLFDSPLKRSFSSERKFEQDSKAFRLTQCPEESESDLNWTACDPDGDVLKFFPPSYSPKVTKTGLPASCQPSTDGEVTKPDESALDGNSVSSQDKAFLANKFTPLKEAWMNFDFFSNGSIPRMANSISNSLGLNQPTEKDATKLTPKVSRSSTFHGGPRNAMFRARSKNEELKSSLDLEDSPKSMTRSPTLPVTPRSKSLVSGRLPGIPSSGWPFSNSASTFGISRLTSKHSEVFMDSLKSAVTSVSSKLNEFKSSLSATSTPTKATYNSSSNAHDVDRIAYYCEDEICGLPVDSNHVDYLTNNGRADDAFHRNDCRRESTHCRNDPKCFLPHVGSAPLFSSQAFDAFEKLSVPTDQGNVHKVAMEISMTTCSCCMFCSSLLYDEEIMEGWSADDSNLNTQCTFCKAKLVPSLTITVKDFRWDGSMESLMTPAYSSDSVSSAPVMNSGTSSFNSGSMQSRPKMMEDKNSTKNSSIDSSNEPFILFERESEEEKDIQQSLNAVVQDLQNSVGPKRDANVVKSNRDLIRNPVNGSFDEPDLSSPINAIQRKKSESVHSSGSDIRRPSVSQASEPLIVPYLSPLVLRKELENVLEHEGDNCMTKSEFVDQHPILFWNLLWFFKRIGVPSHLSSLILMSQSVTKGRQIPILWQKADTRNVVVQCSWDNPKLHEDMGPPLYVMWSNQENRNEQSSLLHALVMDETKSSKNVMKQVLAKLQCNDLHAPICTLINERRKCLPARKRHHSIYREILFLSFIAINRQDIDNLTFDMEYRKAYALLSDKQLSQLQKNDKPPSEGAVFCRRYFKDLELRIR